MAKHKKVRQVRQHQTDHKQNAINASIPYEKLAEKQMVPKCLCGRQMYFRQGENKALCPKCKVKWERGMEGFWAIGNFTTSFTPIFTKEKTCSVKSRAERYKNYPKQRRRKKK